MSSGVKNSFSKSPGAGIIRGTDQQVGNFLLAKTPTAATQGLWQAESTGMQITKFGLSNRSGTADISVGIGFKLQNRVWRFFKGNDSVYTEDTADAQSSVANSVSLGEASDDDGGWAILSTVPFNWISMNVTTTSTSTGKTSILRHSNAAGSGWSTIAAGTPWVDNFTVTTGTWVNETSAAWPTPANWGLSNGLDDLPNGYYAISSLATTEPAAEGLAGGIEIGTIVSAKEDVDDNATFGEEVCSYWEPNADAIVVLFSTGSAANYATCEWVHRG